MIKLLYYIDIGDFMKAKLYDSKTYVNPDVGYTMRLNFSTSENFELHYHNYFEFFLTISGNVLHVINGKRQMLPKHSLQLIRPGDEHTYIKEGEFSFANLTFTKETMHLLSEFIGDAAKDILNRSMPPAVVLSEDDFSKIMSKLNELNTVSIDDKKIMTVKMKFILSEILSFFIEGDVHKEESQIPLWLSHLTHLLQKSENINMTLSDMSHLTKKSREHISRSFKKYFGLTVSEFMTAQRLNYSANLLLNTNLSVIDICFECGFQNLSWFYRKFKEKFFLTPIQFRKKANI